MSATITRQGSRLQLEQFDMRLRLNIATEAKGEYLHGILEEWQYLINKPHGKVYWEKKWEVEIPGNKQGKVGMKRKPAMVHKNQTAGWLPCPNSTARISQTCWRHKDMGAPPPELAPLRLHSHLLHLVTIRQLKVLKLKLCHQDI